MTTLKPDTLYSRIIVLLVTGITATHMFSLMLHYYNERLRDDYHVSLITEKYIADTAKAIAMMPQNLQAKYAEQISNQNLEIRILSSDPGLANVDEVSNNMDEFAHAEAFSKLRRKSVAGDYRINEKWRDCPVGFICSRTGELLAAGVILPSGKILEIFGRIDSLPSSLLDRVGKEFIVMVLGTTVFGLLAAQWVNRPLKSAAFAAERLGRNIHAAKMEEVGPQEVRRLAKAFNDMQERLKRFVDDRTQMLAAISHDLRTLITRLQLRAEFLGDADQRDGVLANLSQMERMTDSVLAFSRDEYLSERSSLIDIVAIVESVCNEALDSGSRVSFSTDGTYTIYGRPFALTRAFDNLVFNAIKYGNEANVEMYLAAGGVTIAISDRGPGLEDHELEEVFRPFYRADTARNLVDAGSGLGLSIARSILRSHGGDITLENRVEGGLRAVVFLPFAPPNDFG